MAGLIGSYKIAISPDLASFKEVSKTVGSSLRGAQQQIERNFSFKSVSSSAASAAAGLGHSFSAAGGVAARGLSVIGSTVSSIGSAAASVASTIGSTFAAAGKTAAAGLAAAAGSLATQLPAALKSSDILQGYGTSLLAAGFSEQEVASTQKALRDFADKTEYDLNDVMNVSASLAANGVQGFTGLTKALGGFVSTFNLEDPAQGFKQLAFVINQVAAAGRVMTGDWYQIQNAAPAAAGVLRNTLKEIGAYTGEFKDALSAGQISSEELFAALEKIGGTDAAQAAATSVDTFSGAIGNFQASIQGGWLDILDRFKPAITRFIAGPLTTVSTAVLEKLGGFLEKVSTLFLNSEGQIKSFSQVLRTIFTGLNFNSLVTSASTALTSLGTRVTAVLQGLVPAVTTALNSLDFQTLFSRIGLAADAIWQQLLSIDWTSLWEAVVGAAGRALAAIPTLFSISVGQVGLPSGGELAVRIEQAVRSVLDFGGLILSKIADGLNWAASNMSTIASAIGAALNGLLDGIADWLFNADSSGSTGAQKLFTAMSQLFLSAMENIDQIGAPIGEFLGRALGGIDLSTVIQNVFKTLGALIKGLFSFLSGLLKGVIDGFRQQLSTGGTQAVQNSASTILGAMNPAFASMIGWANQKAGELVAQFSGKSGDMASAGRQLMNGLDEGAREQWKATTSKNLANIGKTVVQDFRALWQIHSPSKVFAEMGSFLMRGLEQGVQSGAAGVYKTAESFSTKLTSALSVQPEVAFSTASTKQQLQQLAQERLAAQAAQQPAYAASIQQRTPQIIINQEIAKMDDLASLYGITKRAATGYFARALA